jgi:hypothetical protein
MSLLKSIGKVVGNVARAVTPVLSTVNPALGGLTGIASHLGQRSTVMPGAGLTSSLLPGMGALPMIGAAAGTAVRVGIVGARAAMRGAITLCRRNPGWCSTIGGTAAVAAMIESGQLPAPKRRRGRGLSARDLRGFRKTSRLMRQVASSIGLRRGGARGRGTSSTMITQN